MDDSVTDSVTRLWAPAPTINTALPPPCLRSGQLNNKSKKTTAKTGQCFCENHTFIIFRLILCCFCTACASIHVSVGSFSNGKVWSATVAINDFINHMYFYWVVLKILNKIAQQHIFIFIINQLTLNSHIPTQTYWPEINDLILKKLIKTNGCWWVKVMKGEQISLRSFNLSFRAFTLYRLIPDVSR